MAVQTLMFQEVLQKSQDGLTSNVLVNIGNEYTLLDMLIAN